MSETTIDQRTIDRLLDDLGGDTDFLNELIETFLSTAPGLVDEIGTAVEAGDTAAIRMAAHSLKSNCASLGALRMAEMCMRIEGRAQQGELPPRSDYDSLRAQAGEVQVALAGLHLRREG